MARHNAERMSSLVVIFALQFLLQVIGFDFGISNIATTLLLELPNSRAQELEGGVSACLQREC